MIYFDSAATSWPKPDAVWQAMEYCMKEAGANPGRSGHRMAVKANHIVNETRKSLARLFNVEKSEQISFTLNATEALNLAIKGLVRPGDHVITSSMEHNSVTRPLHYLSEQGVEVTKVPCSRKTGEIKIEDIDAVIRPNSKAIIMTHASNVTGTLMPIKEIGRLAKENGLFFIVDAAQTAGVFEIDVQDMNIDLLAFPGHKSLLGPTGTGGLYIREGLELIPLKHGGTGRLSEVAEQPNVMPDRYESGTVNSFGIAGLGAAVKYLNNVGIDKIRNYELELTREFLVGSRNIKGIKIYGIKDIVGRAPVVSFTIEGRAVPEVAAILQKTFNIACRAGIHCAPDAHKTLGTLQQKLIRFSFSHFNIKNEVYYALNCLADIAGGKVKVPEYDDSCNC
ncbi:aminotransferase class V-fold PLP-dependent enzyme [Desulfolucanica intricata]|uniref:aminotransferase class V-fold PLP-dependent enzyme n=1 Tax=Desulfolucanica intricata TaxID=1285191 RepID=UPI0008364417|nr:aminotransferase class V-fold PLP-dependent enzyme [Desulfolucanica intricata]